MHEHDRSRGRRGPGLHGSRDARVDDEQRHRPRQQRDGHVRRHERPDGRQQHEQHDAHDGQRERRPQRRQDVQLAPRSRPAARAGPSRSTSRTAASRMPTTSSLTDSVDSRLIVDSIAAGSYTCDAPSQSISCTLLHIPAGATQVDHGHLPRRFDDGQRRVGEQHGARESRTSTADTTGSASVQIVENVLAERHEDVQLDDGHRGRRGQAPSRVSVTNSGVSDADNVSLTDTVDSRLIVDSVTAGSYTCPDGDATPDDHLHARALWRRARRRSITVTYHVASTTEQRGGRRATARTAHSDEDGPTSGSDTVDIVEDVAAHASRRRSTRRRSRRAARARRSRSSVTNSGVSDADNVSLTDTVDARLHRRVDRGRRLHLRRRASQSITCTLGASGGGRDEVDHRHLPRRHDDEQRSARRATRRTRPRTRTRRRRAPMTSRSSRTSS